MKDRFGREINYLRISVTDLCNLRCRYCMPEQGVSKKCHEDMMTEDEMIRAVAAASSLGIRKVRITGGEPLVKKNILSICERTAAAEGIREVCLTTNGILLPQMAGSLREAGVKRLNISLDTLNPEKYACMTRGGALEQALAGLEAALSAGFEKIKINAVLIGGFNEDEIRPLAGLTRQYPVDVRFIELMPMYDSGDFRADAFLSDQKVLEVLPELESSAWDGGTARLYRLPGSRGNIGLIRPVSAHFCGTCSRIRLTADGRLKPCLHAPEEYPIRGMTQEEMRYVMEQAIWNKPACHDVLSAENRSRAGRSMNQIGG